MYTHTCKITCKKIGQDIFTTQRCKNQIHFDWHDTFLHVFQTYLVFLYAETLLATVFNCMKELVQLD